MEKRKVDSNEEDPSTSKNSKSKKHRKENATVKSLENHIKNSGRNPDREVIAKAFVEALQYHPVIWKRPKMSQVFTEEMRPAYEKIVEDLKKTFCDDLETLRYYEFDDVEGLKQKWSAGRALFRSWQRKVKDGKISEEDIKWYLYHDYKSFLDKENSGNVKDLSTKENEINSNEVNNSSDDTFSNLFNVKDFSTKENEMNSNEVNNSSNDTFSNLFNKI